MKRIIPGLLFVALALAGLGALLIPRTTTTVHAALAGTILPQRPAPDFRLTDQFGHTVSLSGLRGHIVVLTFLEAHCTQLCPLVAEDLRRIADELGPAQQQLAILAISTDPEGDTPAAVRSFSRAHGMLSRWHYLVGSRRQLSAIWHAYFIYAAPPGSSLALDAAHTSATYLVDARSRERVLMSGDLDAAGLERDIRILAGLPVGNAAEQAVPAPETGHPAPDFSLPSLGGSSTSVRSLRGRVVLLNFWRTTCTVCLSEMPRLDGWYRQLRGRGLVVLGVNDLESRSAARDYVRKLHVTYPILLDGGGDVSARYDVAWLPKSVLVDAQGIVESVHLGVLDSHYLSGQVEPLLGGSHHG